MINKNKFNEEIIEINEYTEELRNRIQDKLRSWISSSDSKFPLRDAKYRELRWEPETERLMIINDLDQGSPVNSLPFTELYRIYKLVVDTLSNIY